MRIISPQTTSAVSPKKIDSAKKTVWATAADVIACPCFPAISCSGRTTAPFSTVASRPREPPRNYLLDSAIIKPPGDKKRKGGPEDPPLFLVPDAWTRPQALGLIPEASG
jgi:hypothetical protein